jgi:hypothetical protein
MRIAFHVYQLDHRGSSVTVYDYAVANEELLGNESVIISSRQKSTHPIEKFQRFRTVLYDDVSELDAIIQREKIDLLYMAKYGTNDGITPGACRTVVHAVFRMEEPHGSIYAGVSEYLALKFRRPYWVPHIVRMPPIGTSLRAELGIPESAFVVGRHGGFEQFNVPFVPEVVKNVLNLRKDLYFVFLNTKPFCEHERVRYLPFHPDEDGTYKRRFINSCDAMLHARLDGETFGLAVGEFSAMNRPVISFNIDQPWYDKSHLHILGDKAIIYQTPKDLMRILLTLDRKFVASRNWDAYTERFSPRNVMGIFNEVFVHGKSNNPQAQDASAIISST